MAYDLKSKSARSKLGTRREPYWHRIEAGFYAGYRVLQQGDGTWIARFRNEEGKQEYEALGTQEGLDDAIKAAREWRSRRSAGIDKASDDKTVADACRDYIKDLEARKGIEAKKDAAGRFRRLVHDAEIGKVKLAKLSPKHVRDWLNAQVLRSDETEDEEDEDAVRKFKDSANRNFRSLKAALNLAKNNQQIQSDIAWSSVEPFKGVGARRVGVLDKAQRRALLDECREDFKLFATLLLLTGARPGEIAKIKSSHFDAVHHTLELTGKTGKRTVTLSKQANGLLKRQAEDKKPGDYLFTNTWGNVWTKDTWKEQFRMAADSAGIPAHFVLYHIRHTAISQMLSSGISPGVVSQLAGTSIEMIHRHYGHLLHRDTQRQLDRIAML